MEANLIDLKFELWLRNRENDNIIWTTKQGDKISIKRMSDSHLTNAIHFLEKKEEIENSEGPDIGDLVNIEECGDR